MEIIPNVIAMICTFVAMIMLGRIFPKIGGSIGRMIKLIIVGLFFSLFLHAGFELAEAFHLLGENILMPIMGILMSIGSIALIAAGWVGLKSLE